MKMAEEELSLEHVLLLLKDIYENKMPFDKLLGVQVTQLSLDEVRVRVDMREELIGNYARTILHGGVISSILDLTGGLIASVDILKDMEKYSPTMLTSAFTRMGTIDLRVDYLRAGRGDFFTASGSVLRKGNRVAVIRSELENNEGLLIAAGTGTYLIG